MKKVTFYYLLSSHYFLTSCEKEDSYFKQFSVSNIISDTGRVRVVDLYMELFLLFDTQNSSSTLFIAK